MHAHHGALQRGVGVEHDAVAHLRKFFDTNDGCFAANHHVHALRLFRALWQRANVLGSGVGPLATRFVQRLPNAYWICAGSYQI